MDTSLARNNHGGEFDNRAVVLRMVKLRAERAALLGYPNHAAYQFEDQTAKNIDTVNKLLARVAPPAVANARREAADMQNVIDQEKGGFQLASWDWAFYAEKVRQNRYAFDEVGDQTVLRDQSRIARWRLLRGQQALRPHFQGTP